uniref:Histidinol-phosphatase n=1 Tax=candidate division WOR-3 bacterium TaxID=2052148 RepID=A0A7C4GHJ7_UNCW3
MIDYHVHPDFSHDARGSVEDYCRRAVEIGVEEVCFTTHYEPDPKRAAIEHVVVGGERRATDSDWPRHYLSAIEESRRRFSGLVVRAGVEVGYEKGLDGMIAGFLSRYEFDFVLCGNHHLDHVAITASAELDAFRETCRQRGAEWFAEAFFDYVRAAANSGLFDCVAHLDIYRKYVGPLFGPELDVVCRDRLLQVVKDLAAAGVGLEVNTAGLRRRGNETYPPEWVVRAARDAGVTVFTVGSDAHRPEDLGAGIETACAMLARLGLRPARFSGRRATV